MCKNLIPLYFKVPFYLNAVDGTSDRMVSPSFRNPQFSLSPPLPHCSVCTNAIWCFQTTTIFHFHKTDTQTQSLCGCLSRVTMRHLFILVFHFFFSFRFLSFRSCRFRAMLRKSSMGFCAYYCDAVDVVIVVVVAVLSSFNALKYYYYYCNSHRVTSLWCLAAICMHFFSLMDAT